MRKKDEWIKKKDRHEEVMEGEEGAETDMTPPSSLYVYHLPLYDEWRSVISLEVPYWKKDYWLTDYRLIETGNTNGNGNWKPLKVLKRITFCSFLFVRQEKGQMRLDYKRRNS